jgi:Fe-S oxidoreductase
VLEPGCLSVFRDELKKMLPADPAAQKLSRLAMSLGELLAARGWKPPRVEGQALVHGHCHQKALGGMREDLSLLSQAGMQVDAPDMGCCGMAGSFGFRPETYEASLRIAGLSLMPKVRGLSRASLVVANGFSCREQIEDLSGRETLHLAEVLARGLPGKSTS